EVDVLALRGDVGEEVAAQGIDRARDDHGRRLVPASLEVDDAAALRVGREIGDGAAELADIRAVVRLDEVVGEIEAASREGDAVDADVARLRRPGGRVLRLRILGCGELELLQVDLALGRYDDARVDAIDGDVRDGEIERVFLRPLESD